MALGEAIMAESISESKIARDLQGQIAKSVYVEKSEDGQLYIATPFAFGDGDQPVIALIPNGGGWMLSDLGSTFSRLGFQMNESAMADPANRQRLNSALSIAGIKRHNDELTKPLQNGEYAGALFDFVHALLKIDEFGDFGAAAQNHGRIGTMANKMHPRTPKVFEYLKQCAAQHAPPHTVSLANVGLAARGTATPLYYIRDECLKRNLPPLTAIVVKKATGLPGTGLKPDGTQVTEAEWKDMLGQVFANDWSDISLENHD